MSVLHLLKRHFKRNRSIIIIFIVCQICSVMSYCFAFLYINSIQSYNQGDITVSIITEPYESADEFVKKAEQLYADHSDSIKHIYFSTVYQDFPFKINHHYRNINDLYLRAGFYFQSNDTPQCIVGSYRQDSMTSLRVGDQVEIYGVSHEVIGISGREEWEINSAAIANIPELANLNIVLDKGVSKTTEKHVLTQIEQVFPTATIRVDRSGLSFWECISGLEMIMFVAILLIVNINFIGLFLYIMREDRSMIVTLRLLGCTITRAVWISFKEVFVLCTLSFAVGSLLFQIAISRLISFLNSDFIPSLPLHSIGIIYLLYIGSMILLFIPLIRYQYRKNIFISGRSKEKD